MAAARVPLFYRITSGIRISARPFWLREQLHPLGHFIFTYHIRIENSGKQAAQLRRRRWLIHDEGAGDTVVEGEGVVGEQPRLIPGAVHEYDSFCVLTTPRGWMEGSYLFVRDDGTSFDAAIPRFTLVADVGPDATS